MAYDAKQGAINQGVFRRKWSEASSQDTRKRKGEAKEAQAARW